MAGCAGICPVPSLQPKPCKMLASSKFRELLWLTPSETTAAIPQISKNSTSSYVHQPPSSTCPGLFVSNLQLGSELCNIQLPLQTGRRVSTGFVGKEWGKRVQLCHFDTGGIIWHCKEGLILTGTKLPKTRSTYIPVVPHEAVPEVSKK